MNKTSIESLFSFNPSAKAAISFVYDYLSSLQNTSLVILKSAVENGLGLDITDDQWEDALDNGLIQFKVLHGLYYSKVKLAKIYLRLYL